MLKLAIAVPNARKITTPTRGLLKVARALNVQTALIDPRSTVVDIRDDHIRILVNGRPLEADGVLNRIAHDRAEILVQALESAGVRVVNSSTSVRLAHNKALSSLFLSAAGLPQPYTMVVPGRHFRKVRHLVREWLPLVRKPLRGSLGKRCIRVMNARQLRKIPKLYGHRRYVYLQQYLKNPGRDIRVVTIEGQAVGAMYRYARAGEWRTNLALGGIARPCPLTPELESLAVAAAEAVGLRIAGVDILETQHGLTVLEVNSVPYDVAGFERGAGMELAPLMIESALGVFRRKPQPTSDGLAGLGHGAARERMSPCNGQSPS